MFKKGNMQYRRLGNSGLLVSVLSYGNFGTEGVISHGEQVKIFKTLLYNGVNYFDTDELYSDGKDEEHLGKVLKEINQPRQRYVISTKIWKSPDPSINSKEGTNRKHVKQSIKASLKRLQLQYVDVVYAHSFDEHSPIEQICRAFHEIIEDGLTFYWGTSNWDASNIFEAMQVCEKYNLHKPIAGQNQYNMINRQQIETEYRTLFQKYHYGLAAYSPLLSGYLTGKYLDDKEAQGRLNDQKTGVTTKQQAQFRWFHNFDFEKNDKALRQLRQIAEKELSCDLTALALAWVIKFPHTSSAICGARNVQQLQKSLKSIEVYKRLTNELEARINKILDTNPPARMDWKTFTPAHIQDLQLNDSTQNLLQILLFLQIMILIVTNNQNDHFTLLLFILG